MNGLLPPHWLPLAMLAFAASLGNAAAAVATTPLHSIADVLALPATEFVRRRPAMLRGRVTFLRSHSGVIQDDATGEAIFLQRNEPAEEGAAAAAWLAIGLGTLLEVEGEVVPGGYAPSVVVGAWHVIEPGEPPAAVAADIGRLYTGADDNRRVMIRGVVQGLVERDGGGAILHVETAARRLVLELPPEFFPDPLPDLVDAEIEAIGVAAAFRNTRGEFIAPRLSIARPADLIVTKPPPGPPFAAPHAPLESIARFRVQPLNGHRLQTAGVVSFATPRRLYLQEGRGGVLVELADAGAAAPATEIFQAGDRVEVSGFLDMSRRIGGIVGAVVRRVATGPPPEPEVIQPQEIVAGHEAARRRGVIASSGGFDGRLIRCRGTLEGVRPMAEGVVVLLTDGPQPFAAELPVSAAATFGAQRLAPGTVVELTGIARLDLAGQGVGGLTVEHPAIEQLSILVRTAADMIVVRAPPWWTPRRLAAAVGTLVALVAVAMAWVWFLRREVVRQTARAVAEETARRQAALEYEVGLRERSRLAANLHDTILQTVTGIGFQLKACEKSRHREAAGAAGRADPACDSLASHLAVATKMVGHATDQLRGTVWSLRSMPSDGRRFSEAAAELVERMAAGHDTRIDLRFAPAADRLPPFVAGNLLLVMQEAVHNALVHAAARSIKLSVVLDEPTEKAVVSVRDDGCGFVIGGQSGPTQGHFGLAGMRERAERLGGRLEITSVVGGGTTVRVEVPLDQHMRPLPDRTLSPAAGVG
jgi:signal transduction histidine kinase